MPSFAYSVFATNVPCTWIPPLIPIPTVISCPRRSPKNSWFEIYDYSVGDELVWPYHVSVTLTSSGQYEVLAPVPVHAELPQPVR